MDFQVVETQPAFCLMAKATCGHAELGNVIGQLYGSIIQLNPEAELQSPPRLYYTRWSETDCDIEAALEVDPNTTIAAGTSAKTYPGGKCVTCSHLGLYDTLSDTWMKLWVYVSEQDMEPVGDCYDLYVTDPGQEPDVSKWVTELYIPIA